MGVNLAQWSTLLSVNSTGNQVPKETSCFALRTPGKPAQGSAWHTKLFLCHSNSFFTSVLKNWSKTHGQSSNFPWTFSSEVFVYVTSPRCLTALVTALWEQNFSLSLSFSFLAGYSINKPTNKTPWYWLPFSVVSPLIEQSPNRRMCICLHRPIGLLSARLSQCLVSEGTEESGVWVFLHQTEDTSLGLFKAGAGGKQNVSVGDVSGLGIQVHLFGSLDGDILVIDFSGIVL